MFLDDFRFFFFFLFYSFLLGTISILCTPRRRAP